MKKVLQSILDKSNEEKVISDLLSHGDIAIAKAKFAGLSGVVRFDCMVDSLSGKLKIIELNSDYPDGFLMHDQTFSVLSSKKNESHATYLLNTFGDTGGYIFILYPEEAFFLDAYHLEYIFLKENGIECGIGTVKNLELKNGKYFHDGKEISKIRRCCEVYKLPPGVFLENENIFFNTLHMRALGYKDNLIGGSEYILKSKKVDKENFVEILNNKNSFVLKPNNLSEGKGVVLGIDTSELEWEKELNNALNTEDYIAQEYLNPSKISVDYYDDNQIKTDEMYYDICPHFFINDGKVTGEGHVLMRFSKEKILNVSRGGAIGYGTL